MRQRSPSENFIKFLLSKQQYDYAMVVRVMDDFGLTAISENYVEKLENSMGPFPDPYQPADKKHKASQNFLKKHGIRDLWFPTPAVNEAYSILSSKQLCAEVQQLLLSPLKLEEISRRLTKAHEVKISVDGLAAFSHYFWKKSLLSPAEWVDYLDQLNDASYDRITSLRAAPDTAIMVVPWLTGLSGPPPNLNTGTIARRVRDVAFMKILEIERQPACLAHSKMMLNYEKVVQAAEAEMRQSDVALKDVLQAFEKFRLRKDEKVVPAIEDIAGPNYSKSGEGTGTVHNIMDDDFYPDEAETEEEED
jgi:hypothetical protein